MFCWWLRPLTPTPPVVCKVFSAPFTFLIFFLSLPHLVSFSSQHFRVSSLPKLLFQLVGPVHDIFPLYSIPDFPLYLKSTVSDRCNRPPQVPTVTPVFYLTPPDLLILNLLFYFRFHFDLLNFYPLFYFFRERIVSFLCQTFSLNPPWKILLFRTLLDIRSPFFHHQVLHHFHVLFPINYIDPGVPKPFSILFTFFFSLKRKPSTNNLTYRKFREVLWLR